MPHQPQIISDVAPQFAGRSLSAAQAPGLAAAHLGDQVADIGTQILAKQKNLEQSRKLMEATSNGALAANEFYQNAITDPNLDNAQLAESVQKGLKIVHDRIAKDIKDPEVRLRFDQNFDGLTVSHVINATGIQRQRAVSAANATLANSNDTLAGLAAEHTGQQFDADMSHIEGNIAGAVANKQISADQGQAELSRIKEVIYSAKWKKEIRENPAQAFIDLEHDNHLDPLKKEQFRDEALSQFEAQQREVVSQQQKAAAARDKALADQREAAVSDMTSRALNGTLTHTELEAQRQNLGLNRVDYEKVFDLINKKSEQPPSDPNTLSGAEIAVNAAYPQISIEQLHDMYLQNRLNLDDYTKLAVTLERNHRSSSDQSKSDTNARQAQAEQIIGQEFGGDPAIHAAALKDLTAGSAAFGGLRDPLSVLPDIEKKYGPMMEKLGGSSKAAVLGQFNSARTAYRNAVDAQRKWNTDHYIRKDFQTNPNDQTVSERTNDLLNKAEAASKVLGDAKGRREGSHFILKDGTAVMIVGGKVIAE